MHKKYIINIIMHIYAPSEALKAQREWRLCSYGTIAQWPVPETLPSSLFDTVQYNNISVITIVSHFIQVTSRPQMDRDRGGLATRAIGQCPRAQRVMGPGSHKIWYTFVSNFIFLYFFFEKFRLKNIVFQIWWVFESGARWGWQRGPSYKNFPRVHEVPVRPWTEKFVTTYANDDYTQKFSRRKDWAVQENKDEFIYYYLINH